MSTEKLSTKKKILVQLDSDTQASTFDAVVAIDAGVDHLLQYAGVDESMVAGLVHGCMFTRGMDDLKHTAIFVGGSQVFATEKLASRVRKTFFGPMRVSVMVDGNGSNTTAAAAVVSAHKNLDLSQSRIGILAATGPVGTIAAKLLSRVAKEVRLFSRDISRAAVVAETILAATPDRAANALLTPRSSANISDLIEGLQDCDGVIACGAAGAQLLPASVWSHLDQLKLLIDLNAVPPAGIEGVEAMDNGRVREGRVCFGPIGVGGLKMKIHKAALRKLFETNNSFLDSQEIFEIGLHVG
jgi:methylenetetrahydrofolate/methylenetetrahydromethanopterin dehydrogenase (NADP+)